MSLKTSRAMALSGVLALVLGSSVFSIGCGPRADADASASVIINNPAAPTTQPKVTAAVAAISQVATNLNQFCPVTITHQARAYVNGVPVAATWTFAVTSTPSPKSFNYSGDQAVSVFDLPGSYRITATGVVNGQTITAHTDVVLSGTGCRGSTSPSHPEPRVDLKANGSDGPISVQTGSVVDISWSFIHATSCNWTEGPLTGMVGGNGSQRVTVNQNTRFSMSCTGPGGTDTDSVQVNVTTAPPPPQAPECSISVSPTSIQSGQYATVNWSSSGGTISVTSSWSGSVSLSGSMSVNPTSSTTYSITCSNSAGTSVTRSATLTVTAAPPSDPCAGASASLPDMTKKGQTVGFQINSASNCKWALRSNNHHVVSTNPAEGYGSAWGSVTALNTGTATIQFVVNPGMSNERVVSQKTYTITN